jgi:hypothetical protein
VRGIQKLAVSLMLLNGAWMAFDGSRALVVGDYVRPKSGAHAGRLGPWAALLSAVGLHPRATGVKLGFLLLGLGSVIACVSFFLSAAWSRPALAVLGVLVLWYLPFGTAIGTFLLVALYVAGRQGERRRE